MYTIVVSGIGGVGGYVGAHLARHYAGSDAVRVCFFARKENLEAIRLNGLSCEKSAESFVARPAMVSDSAADFGKADLILCCTKSYDLTESMQALRDCVSENTVVMPLQNGIDQAGQMSAMCQVSTVSRACIYIVARRYAPGRIKEFGTSHVIYFGKYKADGLDLKPIEKLLRDAGLNAHYRDDIELLAWEKFMFISALSSLTCYLDCTVGSLFLSGSGEQQLLDLLNELWAVAEAQQVTLSSDAVDRIMVKIKALPPDTISSMHADFRAGQKVELEALTGRVIQMGRLHGVETPFFEKIYGVLDARQDNWKQLRSE